MSDFRPGPRAIRQQMESVLASEHLAGEPILQMLLAYLVEETLAGREDRLDPYVIGVDLLRREASFDPATDPMVGNQVNRLRRLLSRHYLTEGLGSPIRIDIPDGRLAPTFRAAGVTPRPAVGLASGAAPRNPALARPGGPAVAVLPLRTDPDDAALGTGIAAEIGLRLTRYKDMQVIASHSAYACRGEEMPDIRRIGVELDVRFVVTGRLHRSEREFIVSVRLHDAHSGTLVWVETYETAGSVEHLGHALVDIALNVARRAAMTHGRVPIRLDTACLGTLPDSFHAYEAVLRCRHHYCAPDAPSRDALHATLAMAIREDTRYAVGLAMLSGLEVERYLDGCEADPTDGLDVAFQLAGQAVAMDPSCQQARWNLVYVHLHRHEGAEAVAEAERTVASNPNDADLCGAAGWAMAHLGHWDRGLAVLARNHWLNPRHPKSWHSAWYLDRYRRGDFEGALEYANLYEGPHPVWRLLLQCAALGQLGRLGDARRVADRITSILPRFEQTGRALIRRQVFVDRLDEMILAGLRRSGLAVD